MSLFLQVDPALPEALHVQIYRAIRDALADGRLELGDWLPSTRELAADLRVGRNTVLRALQRLESEGLVQGRVGSGVRVSRSLSGGGGASQPSASSDGASDAGPCRAERRPFLSGVPPLDVFPDRTWARVAARRWRSSVSELKDAADPLGYPRLRRAIAEYLHAVRGVVCDAGQILITSGSHHSLEILLHTLTQRGEAVWVEDPCRAETTNVLAALGLAGVPVPVDREGLKLAPAARSGSPRVVVVTPGCHWPTGASLSARRRHRLVAWAHAANGWIVEDDHYAATRFVGRAQPTVHALDAVGRTIHMGTFADLVFPGLRVGYVVVPAALRDTIAASAPAFAQHAPTAMQAILADFIEEGHFARHLRKIREVIAERYGALTGALHAHCGGVLDLVPADAGVHVVAWLPADFDEEAVVRAAHGAGVMLAGVSQFRRMPGRPGIVLGFGGWAPDELVCAAERLSTVLDRLSPVRRVVERDGQRVMISRAG